MTIEVRTIRPDDRARLAEHFLGLGPTSSYFRFFAPRRKVPDKDLARFTDSDCLHGAAVVATLGGDTGERIVGFAQYTVTDEKTPRADLAVSVVDEYQGLGIGGLLMESLIEIARSSGIAEFEADVLGHNRRMLRLLERSGLATHRSVESGVIHFTFSGKDAERMLAAG